MSVVDEPTHAATEGLASSGDQPRGTSMGGQPMEDSPGNRHHPELP
jgi:hypothetical protein